jgi:hypothetical protein
MTKRYLIGTLNTGILQQHDDGSGIGQYNLPVYVGEQMMDASPDKQGLAKSTISMFLASAIKDTTVPASYWGLAVEPKFQKAFNWPEYMKFNI